MSPRMLLKKHSCSMMVGNKNAAPDWTSNAAFMKGGMHLCQYHITGHKRIANHLFYTLPALLAGHFDSASEFEVSMNIRLVFEVDGSYTRVEHWGESRLEGIVARFLAQTGRDGARYEVRDANGVKVDTRQRINQDGMYRLVRV